MLRDKNVLVLATHFSLSRNTTNILGSWGRRCREFKASSWFILLETLRFVCVREATFGG